MTDHELIGSYCRSSDAAALALFVGRYQMSLVRFAEKLVGDRDAAQDVVQETFLRVAERPARLLDVDSPHNWLLRVARNIGIDWIRKRSRIERHARAAGEALEARAHERDATAAQALEREELRAQVRAEIARLRPRYREILLLKVEEEKSYREIAQITGLSVTNIGYLLHTAMKILQTRLRKRKEDLL